MTLHNRSLSTSDIDKIPLTQKRLFSDLSKCSNLSEKLLYLKALNSASFISFLRLSPEDMFLEVLKISIEEPAFVDLVIQLTGDALSRIYQFNNKLIYSTAWYQTLQSIPEECRFNFLKALFSGSTNPINNTMDLMKVVALLPAKDHEKFFKEGIPLPFLKDIVKKDIFYRVDQNILPIIIKQFDHAFLASIITRYDDLKKAFPLIEPEERLNFLTQHIGMDKLRGLICNGPNLYWLTSRLPVEASKSIQKELMIYRLRPNFGYQEKYGCWNSDEIYDGRSVMLDYSQYPGRKVLVEDENNQVKSIGITLNVEEREDVKLLKRVSKDKFIVLIYDNANIINNYKTWQLHLGSISAGTCNPLFKIHRDQHFYPDQFILLSDNKTLVGWSKDDMEDRDNAQKQVCFINLETLVVQTIEMPYSRGDIVSVQIDKGQLIFIVNGREEYFDVLDTSLESKKRLFPFFDDAESPTVVKSKIDKSHVSDYRP